MNSSCSCFGDFKPLSSLDVTLLSLKIALDPRLVKEHLFNLRNYFPAISQTSCPLAFGPCLRTSLTQPPQKHSFLNNKKIYYTYSFNRNFTLININNQLNCYSFIRSFLTLQNRKNCLFIKKYLFIYYFIYFVI